eukprot:GILK01003345.1.p1 GENE.GILK01003345.1~~GILK01003345.1.p1  ORF type:complete len:237 (+),score=28.96 GILK01003345.1:37-747(+)
MESSDPLMVPESSGLLEAFIASFSMILVSEIGDKTFFIAAVMAMRHDRVVVLAGALGALGAMTVLSTLLGHVLPNLISRTYTHYAAALLFAVFGVRLLKDAWEMEPNDGVNEELEEVEAELNKKDQTEQGADGKDLEDPARVSVRKSKLNQVLMQAFTLTFLAEWGDRSQISTIALAAAKDPWGVTLGGFLGHALCTSVAVVGGRMLATKISERTVALCGGILFMIFALHSVYFGP